MALQHRFLAPTDPAGQSCPIWSEQPMCRYGIYGPYKDHYACFSCRKAFKQAARSGDADARPVVIKCPQCAQPMSAMGLDFKAPKQKDVDQWKKVELLFQNGFTFYSCGCCGPGFRPAELADVDAFIEGQRSLSEGELLLAKIQARVAARDANGTGGK